MNNEQFFFHSIFLYTKKKKICLKSPVAACVKCDFYELK